jgi:hypothetical protein
MEIVVYGVFTLKLQKIFSSLKENIEKIKFVLLFNFTFNYVFLSKHEQLHILMDINQVNKK